MAVFCRAECLSFMKNDTTQYKCRFSDKEMSFSPNVPELDIAISQQTVVRFVFRKNLLQWYAKEL